MKLSIYGGQKVKDQGYTRLKVDLWPYRGIVLDTGLSSFSNLFETRRAHGRAH